MSKIKTIKVFAKCTDRCWVAAIDKKGQTVKEYDGYVPTIIPNRYGDYIDIEIDVATGKIVNWTVPTDPEIKESLEGDT